MNQFSRLTVLMAVVLGGVLARTPADAGEQTGCEKAMVSCTLSDRSELKRILTDMGVVFIDAADLDTLGMAVFSIRLPEAVSLEDLRAAVAPFDGIVEPQNSGGDGTEYRLVID